MGADRKWIIVRIDGKTVDIKGRSHYIQGQRPLYGKSDAFPTDVKLLWECVERAYRMMCGISSQPGEHRLKTKCNNILTDVISFIEKLSFNGFNEGTD